MLINDFVENVQTLNAEREYWFVRTDSGKYFHTYYDHNFIAIGWDYITLDDLKNKDADTVKKRIAKEEGLMLNESGDKAKVTMIYNKLKRFLKLKKGDVILIPSTKSADIAFGIVESGIVEIDINNTHHCTYHKRLAIKWSAKRYVRSLDPIFYQIKGSRHSISSVKAYESYIDNVIGSLFIKGDFAYFNIDIKTKENINIRALTSLMTNLQDLMVDINNHYDYQEDVESSSIKLNLQSPGKVEFSLLKGKTLITLAMILAGCTSNQTTTHSPEIVTFIENNDSTAIKLKNIEDSMKVLDVDIDRIKSLQ